MWIRILIIIDTDADPDSDFCLMDSDPTFQPDADPDLDPDPTFHLMRIRILPFLCGSYPAKVLI
jgi:hypothetical protein